VENRERPFIKLTDKYIIWTLDRNRMDWIFMDRDIRSGSRTNSQHDGYHGCDWVEYKPDAVTLLTHLMHECGDICEYPDFIIDDGNADERGSGRGDGGDVAWWRGSRTGFAAGWRNRHDVGYLAIEQRRGRSFMVAGIFSQLPDCGRWRGYSRLEQRRRNESHGIFI
jgi:hypothetical protein